ncbi:MAG: type II toxin-antitoxin system VapC family toxin [Candidatus Accumulibacter sp.]|uniref:PIN domain-containing protein n=1 Tax=Accumulibacter sp. TaxID=2053492 RepID=UPI001AC6F398|nr:type II toxin-antitoxin system VapC family toxin [Accumulibacter sp.]MBN8519925.1 type II toxin-antitoxin system VapC family toxin [Accumulibacter sp.]MBO3713026.1 type II toxin-antitoxin system VapC family toxin [Accumulibacter sp.]
MIGLDTNVLVRYIMQDDPEQSLLSTRLVESLSVESPGFVALVSVVELGWVLDAAYDLDRQQIADAFEALLRTKEIVVERAETVWKALRIFQRTNADLADCLIERSAAAGCGTTVTFDRGAVKGCGMTLVTCNQ